MANNLSATTSVALNVSNLYPWKDIKDVMVAGQSMVFIPKFYVKNVLVNSYNAYFVCGEQKSGYHLHPAFYNNGQETANGILIGKYLSSGTKTSLESVNDLVPRDVTRTDGFKAINSKNVINGTSDQTGWHPYNIYEHHLLLRLALIEYGGTNFSNITEYHGVCDLGRTASNGKTSITVGYWIDGLKAVCGSDANYFSWVIGNKKRTQEVETTRKPITTGQYVRLMDMETTDDYDLGDVFFESHGVTSSSGGSYGSTQAMTGFRVNITNPYFFCKMFDFAIYKLSPTKNDQELTTTKYVRLAKYV